MSARVYLDWNATAPLRPEARAAMLAAMDAVGNPSSVHAEGRAARAIVEKARGQVARLVGCTPDRVVFTSGATEGAATVAAGVARLLGSDAEHDAVRRHLGGEPLPLTGDGHIALALPIDGAAEGMVVALQAANSETGVLQPVEEIGPRLRQAGARVLCDAVQRLGKCPAGGLAEVADYLLASAHKLGGPKGVGALVLRDGLELTPLAPGGGQELGRRSGTENVTGIAGFGAAAEAALSDLEAGAWERVAKLRNILEERLEAAASDTIFVGRDSERLPNTSCFGLPGWKGETQVMQLDLAGFAVSAGSACSSGKVRRSRVLQAMGFDGEMAGSAIRVSIGPTTTEAEVAAFAGTWVELYQRRRQRAA